jgi:hypothetical protein
MRRAIRSLVLGIFLTAVCIAFVSVYIFHDVDADKVGHLNEAFAGLCNEVVLLTLVIGGPVWVLTVFGRRLFRMRSASPRSKLALLLGIFVTILQYPWELAGRIFVPKFEDFMLSFYLIAAVVVCTAVLLRDNLTQFRLRNVSGLASTANSPEASQTSD